MFPSRSCKAMSYSSKDCFDVGVDGIPGYTSVWGYRWMVSGQRAAVCFANSHSYTQSGLIFEYAVKTGCHTVQKTTESRSEQMFSGPPWLDCRKWNSWVWKGSHLRFGPIWLLSSFHAFRLFRLGLCKSSRMALFVWSLADFLFPTDYFRVFIVALSSYPYNEVNFDLKKRGLFSDLASAL